MRYRIDPYKLGSKSARELSKALGGKRLMQDHRSRYRQRDRHIVINWGSSQPHPRVLNYHFNQPSHVRNASCKLRTFCALDVNNVPCLEWTTRKDIAERWMRDGFSVYCRETTRGHSGRGITIMKGEKLNEDTTRYPDLPIVPLYTKGLQNWEECRIHIAKDGTIIDWQRKLRRNGSERPSDVRNHENDYVFCRNVGSPPEEAFRVATEAIKACKLDFGAIDMACVYNNESDEHECYVIEVNSAPGLEGTTLKNYVSYFKNGVYHERI